MYVYSKVLKRAEYKSEYIFQHDSLLLSLRSVSAQLTSKNSSQSQNSTPLPDEFRSKSHRKLQIYYDDQTPMLFPTARVEHQTVQIT